MPEEVTPRGLPYGEGQKAEQRQRQAGLPTTIQGAAPDPTGRPPADMARPASPVRPQAPASDDPLRVLNPSTPLVMAPTPSEQFARIADRTANPVMRLISMRLAEESS